MAKQQFTGIQKYIHTSPRKLREVVALLSNLTPGQAVKILPQVNKRGAESLWKAIKSVLANAKQAGISETNLTFKEIQINDGPRLKRWRAGARGRAKPYQGRMSHIRITLEAKKSSEVKKKSKVKSETKKEVKK